MESFQKPLSTLLWESTADQKLLGGESAEGAGAGEASPWDTACAAGADACTQVPVPEAGRADRVSDLPESRTHTAPPASVLVAEPRFPKQMKQGLASSAAVCGAFRDCGVVLEFRIPLLHKRKNSLDDMRVPRDERPPSG